MTDLPIKALVVDDEAAILELDKLFLEEAGEILVHTALSAREGFDLLKQEEFDVIVSDYQMPGMDGLEFLKAVKEAGITKPFILFTGKGREDVAIKALNLGAHYYLQKGGDCQAQYAELSNMIRKASETFRSEKRVKESESKYRGLFENIPGIVHYWKLVRNEEGNIIDWALVDANPAALRAWGKDLDDIRGRTASEIFGPEFRDRHMAIVQKISSTGNPECHEGHLDRKDMWFKYCSVPLGDHFITTGMDITELKKAQKTLQANEERYHTLIDILPSGVIHQDDQGRLLTYNSEAERILGVSKMHALGHDASEIGWPTIHEDGSPYPVEEHPSMISLRTGQAITGAIIGIRGGQGITWASINSRPMFDSGGERPSSVLVSFQDITRRKKEEQERAVAAECLRLINQSKGTAELVRSITTFFQQQSGCDAIGIRLRDGEDFPYYETRGFPPQFVRNERSLCSYDENGNMFRESNGNPVLECMCGNIICGRFDPTKPFFTKNGSFWTNSTTALLASTSDADRQARTRNRCNGEGYESVALIPIKLGEERIGLIQLNDRRKGMFTPEAIALWERLTRYVAVALSKCRSEEMLTENEAKYHGLFESVQEAIAIGHLIYDKEGNIADWVIEDVNPAALRFMGVSSLAEARGMRGSDIVGLERLPFYLSMLEEAKILGRPASFEYRSPVRDWDVVTSIVITGDRLAIVQKDITEIKTAQREAEEAAKLAHLQAEEVRTLMDIAPVGIWVAHDPEASLITSNQTANRLYEAERNEDAPDRRPGTEWTGQRRFFRNGAEIGPEELPLQEAAAKGVEIKGAEIEVLLPSGRRVVSLTNARPLLDEDGKVRGSVASSIDITSIKDAQQELEEERSRLRTIIDTMPVGVFITDASGKAVMINDTLRDIWRGSRPLDSLERYVDYKAWHRDSGEVVRPEDWPIVHALRTGEPYKGPEFDFQRFDGNMGVMIASAVPIKSEKGLVIGGVAIAHDVTKLKLAEQHVRDGNASLVRERNLLQSIMNSAKNFHLIYLDRELNFVRVNETYARTCGFEPEEMVGKNHFDLYPNEENKAIFRRAVETGEAVGFHDWPFSFPDKPEKGVTYWDWTLEPVKGSNGEVEGLVFSLIETTERKKAEDALRESEHRYRALFENSFDAVILGKEDGSVLAANPAASRMLGMTEEEIRQAGRKGIMIDDENLRAALKERERTGKIEAELSIRRKDGTLFVADLASTLFNDTNGITMSSVIFKDVTERKRARDALRSANRKLNLLSSITRHDLKNMLMLLDGNISLLEARGSETEVNARLAKMKAVTQKMAAMIQFTKTYERLGMEEPGWYLIRGLVDTASRDVIWGDVRLVNDLPLDREVLADPLMVKVFYNLMDNAIRHGGKVTEVRLRSEDRAEGLAIICQDDGAGVPLDEKENIFQLGYGTNTGLGLFLSREILELTGVTIKENGEPGEGARFEMLVPTGRFRTHAD